MLTACSNRTLCILLFVHLLPALIAFFSHHPLSSISMSADPALVASSAAVASAPAAASLSDAEVDTQLADLGSKFAAVGQGHVTAWVPELSQEQKRNLLADLREIRVENLARDWAAVQQQTEALAAAAANPAAAAASAAITPFLNVTTLADTHAATRDAWTARGLELLADGRVAALLMAGGQGTRLGSSDPKGCFNIGLLSGKSLFQLQAERLHRLRSLAAEASKRSVESVHIRWYIMTSIVTHSATIAFFRAHRFFDLPEADCFFFQQSELPALDGSGRILMERKDKISLAPNGNGGIFEGLLRQGALDDMRAHNIAAVHVYGVDNVLARVADPAFLGWAWESRADCANKVVLKTEPSEKVGVMCLRGGKPSVVEYSELSSQMASARSEDSGRLLYSAANIVQHYFTFQFLEQHALSPLSYHVAHKAIPFIDPSTGHSVSPAKPNGVKLEMFVFDAFERSNNMQCLAVDRASEFSPVKNAATGPNVVDTPITARRDLSAAHCAMLRKAGVTLINKESAAAASSVASSEPQCECEISPLVSYAGEGLERLAGKQITLPVYITPESIGTL